MFFYSFVNVCLYYLPFQYVTDDGSQQKLKIYNFLLIKMFLFTIIQSSLINMLKVFALVLWFSGINSQQPHINNWSRKWKMYCSKWDNCILCTNHLNDEVLVLNRFLSLKLWISFLDYRCTLPDTRAGSQFHLEKKTVWAAFYSKLYAL